MPDVVARFVLLCLIGLVYYIFFVPVTSQMAEEDWTIAFQCRQKDYHICTGLYYVLVISFVRQEMTDVAVIFSF